MRRSDDNSVVQMSYWGCGFLFGALFTILLTSCGPFNYDPSPWCTTRDGKKDCTRAAAERDSPDPRADTSRKGEG